MKIWQGVIVATFVASAALGASVHASDEYLLVQKIDLIDCTTTHTDDGTGQTNSTECDGLVAPTVDPVSTTNTRPILTGTYDQSTMRTLRVTVRGVTYTLGIDHQLTVSGGRWRLDLSSLLMPLTPGEYTVVVEIETIDDKLLRSGSQQQVVIIATPDTSAPGPVREDGGPLARTGESLVYILIGGAVLLVAGALLLLGLHHHRRR